MRLMRALPRSRMVVDRVRFVTPVLGSHVMGMLLTKRRAVDLCRVATCLCPAVF
jgi:hypothetical protein